MQQLQELHTHLARLPFHIVHANRLDDTLQTRLLGLSLALRALADLESDRLRLDRTHRRIATLSQAITGEWSAELRRTTLGQPASEGAAAYSQTTFGPSATLASIPGLATLARATVPRPTKQAPSKLAAPSAGQAAASRDAAVRQALGKESKAFSEAYARALEAFDARWTRAADLVTRSGHPASPEPLTATRSPQPSAKQQQRPHREGRYLDDPPRPPSSWLGSDVEQGVGQTGTSMSPRNAGLLLKVLRFGIGNMSALASSIIRSSISDESGAGVSQSRRLSQQEVSAVFGLVVAARGPSAALELAEKIFVQAIRRSEQLDGRESDLLFMAILDTLHVLDIHEDPRGGSGHGRGAASASHARNMLLTSPALELELLTFLEESRRWEAINCQTQQYSTAHPLSPSMVLHTTNSASSPWWPDAASAALPFTALGNSAADVWNASLQTGRTTIGGLLAAGGSLGSRLMGRTGHDTSASTAQPSSPREVLGRASENPMAAATAAVPGQKKGSIRVPPTLSTSRFVRPTTGVAATTAEVHAAGSDLSLSSPHQHEPDSKAHAGEDSAFSSLSVSAQSNESPLASQTAPTTTATTTKKQSRTSSAHSVLEAIASASAAASTSSDSGSPFVRSNTRGEASWKIPIGDPIQVSADQVSPVATFAPKILAILAGSVDADAITGDGGDLVLTEKAAPMVCRLSQRLFRVHFPKAGFPQESRKIRLIIIVRWFAFTILRDLITRTESLGRALRGGSLIWAAQSTRLVAKAASPWEDVHEPTGDKAARGFEDVWTSDELTCRALNELHRALYSGIVKCAEVSSTSAEESKMADLIAKGCQQIVAFFGAGGDKGPGVGWEPTIPLTVEVRTTSITRQEALAFTKAAMSGYIDAVAQATASPPVRSPPASDAYGLRQAGVEDLESLLQELSLPQRSEKQADSADVYDLPLIYTAFDPVSKKAHVSTSLAKADAFVVEAQKAHRSQPSQSRPNLAASRAFSIGSQAAVLTDAPKQAAETSVALGSSFLVPASSAPRHIDHVSGSSGWESPPCSPFAEKTLDSLFQLDAHAIEAARREGAATPTLSTATSLVIPGAEVTVASSTGPSNRRRTNAELSDTRRGQIKPGSRDDSALAGSEPPISIDVRRLPVDEIQRGVLALIRRGYMNCGGTSLLTLLRAATQRATEQENFNDAALFQNTASLLHHCARLETRLIKVPGTTSPTDFAQLVQHILAPLQEADRKHRSRSELAQVRLLSLEASWDNLVVKARILLSSLQEMRTRCWYASEIRASPEVADSIVTAAACLYGAQKQPDQDCSMDAASWMQSLGIHDMGLAESKAAFVRELDPAFQRIVRDAVNFFASPFWSREAVLAGPYLSAPKYYRADTRMAGLDRATMDIFSFGAGARALLQPGEGGGDTLGGLEAFLQRVQLSATGLLLSEAMATATEVQACALGHPAASLPSEKPDPDEWVRSNIGLVADSLQHRDTKLASQLASMGVERLLQRFDLVPSPHQKMRALFNVTRLIVAHLSMPSIPDAGPDSQPSAQGPGTAAPRRPSPMHRQGSASHYPRASDGSRRPMSRHSRHTTETTDAMNQRGAKSRSNYVTSSAASPLSASLVSRPASHGGFSEGSRRARRALSMYVDDNDDEEGEGSSRISAADEGLGERGAMPNIHNLLALIEQAETADHDADAAAEAGSNDDGLDGLPPSTSHSSMASSASGAGTAEDGVRLKSAVLHHPEPPSTDTLLNALESVLIHHLCPPKTATTTVGRQKTRARLDHLYLYLQLVCAFSPTAVLDWKEEGKALWDVVLAASSVRSEVASRCLEAVEGSGEVEGNEKRRVLMIG
ncbi:hypothetical protein ACQY0O_004220 [Thecaphora frezii]